MPTDVCLSQFNHTWHGTSHINLKLLAKFQVWSLFSNELRPTQSLIRITSLILCIARWC